MQKQRLFLLILGAVLALAAVVMVKVYLERERQQISKDITKQTYELSQKNRVTVLVAKKDIPRGSNIDSTSVKEELVPPDFIQPQAVSSLTRTEGMITVVPIAQGEQITLTKLAFPREMGGLAELTPAGKRAITIPVDNIASLAGLIKPGNYVDAIAMIPVPVETSEGQKPATQLASIPLFQNVLVLAVGQDTGSFEKGESGRYKREIQGGKGGDSSLITLALSPEEANLIAFVQEQGRIRLTLRSPTDALVQQVNPATWETLFRHVMPHMFKDEPAPQEENIQQEPVAPYGYVEIYRGTSKEKVPISK